MAILEVATWYNILTNVVQVLSKRCTFLSYFQAHFNSMYCTHVTENMTDQEQWKQFKSGLAQGQCMR